MKESQSSQEQNHPLYAADRDHVDRLLAKELPKDEDLIDLARLLIRYEGFQGADDIKSDMARILKLWGLSHEALNARTRRIWSKGFRPGESPGSTIGSGFDTSDNGGN